MGTKNFSNANDLITFSRASGGTALRKVAYGPELVTNGTFDSDISGWTNGSNAGGAIAWSAGAINLANTSGTARAYQSFSTEVGKVYRVLATETGGTTSFQVYVGESQAVANNINATTTGASSTFDGVFVATAATTFINVRNLNAATTAAVDNISVKEVLFDDASGDLTLFNHPADVPRIEYDADGNVLGLLVEESRTNLVTYSDISNAAWGATRATKVTEAETSPAGTIDAVGIVASTNNDSHYLSDSFTVVSGSTYTASAYLKAGTKKWATLYNGSGNSFFDLENGVVGFVTGTNNTTAKIQDVGNGWYRCSISFDAAATSYLLAIGPALADEDNTYIGDNVSEEVYIYGAQLEAGAFPTSYIPTAGATATRSADVASIPVADFGYNQSEGTVVVDINTPLSTGEINYAFALDDGSALNMISIYRTASDVVIASTNTSGVNQGNLNLKTSALGKNKAAYVLSTDDSAAVCTGESVQTDATYNLPTVTDLVIGDRSVGNRELNGHIKSIKYYPRRLSNAQLVELTS